MLTKIARFFLWNIFNLILLTLFITVLVGQLVRPPHLKQWISGSGIYSTAVDGVISQSAQTQTDQKSDGPSLSDPAIQSAAKKAFTPTFLQTSTENIIDGTFHWLDGKTAKPDFKVDLTSTKATFADGVGEAARQRVAGLPACAPRQIPKDTDPFSITCRPLVGFNIDTEIAAFVAKVKTNKDFLPDPVITAATVTNEKNGVKQSVFDQQPHLPARYQLFQKLPVLLAAASLVLAALLVFTVATRLDGLRNVGADLLVWAFVGGLLLTAGSFAISMGRDKLTKQHTQSPFLIATKDNVLRLIDGVSHDFTKTGLEIVGAYAVTGGVLVSVSIVAKRRKDPKKENKEKLAEAIAEDKAKTTTDKGK